MNNNIEDIINKAQVTHTTLTPIINKDKIRLFTIETFDFAHSAELRLNVNNILFNCLFQVPNNPDNRLIVMLQGGRTQTKIIDGLNYFYYQRSSYYNFTNAFQLNIIDPTQNIIGVKGIYFYIKFLTELKLLISKAMEKLNISTDHLFFWGGSAGGTAGILLSQFFKGCTVIAANAQINFRQKNWVKWLNLSNEYLKLDFSLPIYDIPEIITQNPINTYILAENIASSQDWARIKKLSDKLELKLSLGVQKYNNIGIWLFYRPSSTMDKSAHSLQETKLSARALYQFSKIVKEGKELTPELIELFNIITEYWNKE